MCACVQACACFCVYMCMHGHECMQWYVAQCAGLMYAGIHGILMCYIHLHTVLSTQHPQSYVHSVQDPSANPSHPTPFVLCK